MTTQLDEAIEQLRNRATAAVADKPQTRRPTWAPPLPLEGELLTVFHELWRLRLERRARWVARKPDKRSGIAPPTADEPILRLWACFHDPRNAHRPGWANQGGHDCCGFDLRFGTRPNGGIVTAVRKGFSGAWAIGPRWKPTGEEEVQLIRARDLGAEVLAALAGGTADGQIEEASRTLAWCRSCQRPLTEPASIEAGIGPECLANAAKFSGAPKATVREGAWRRRKQMADVYEP